jgi:hypothetical protein
MVSKSDGKLYSSRPTFTALQFRRGICKHRQNRLRKDMPESAYIHSSLNVISIKAKQFCDWLTDQSWHSNHFCPDAIIL